MLKTPYAQDSYYIYEELILNEAFHVTQEMYDVSEDIFNAIKKRMQIYFDCEDYAGIIRLLQSTENRLYYTGWNVRSFLETDIDKFKNKRISPFFVKCNNEDAYTPIYFSFNKSGQPESFMAAATVRPVWSLNRKNKDIPLSAWLVRQQPGEKERVVIYINNSYFLKNATDKIPSDEESTWIGIISHELQHVLEQFVNKTENNLLKKPNNLEAFFRFDLSDNKDKEFYTYADIIIECLAPDEQRARSTQMEIILNQLEKDPASRYVVLKYYNEHLNKRKHFGIPIDNQLRVMTVSLLNNSVLKYVHRIATYYNVISNVIALENETNCEFSTAIMLVGYYLLKFGMIKTDKKKLLKYYLTKENIDSIVNDWENRYHTSDFQTVRKEIIENIKRLYFKYEQLVYRRAERHAGELLTLMGIQTNDENNTVTINSTDNGKLSLDEIKLLENIHYNIKYIQEPKTRPLMIDGHIVMY